jgi:Zn-finger nucleic acid-binding protein
LNNEPTVCPQCRAKLIEIDHYGQRLIGCVECNRWTWRGSTDHLIMQLPEEDIDALRRRRAAKRL